jgi:outer membrane translocation and assembly module TamA
MPSWIGCGLPLFIAISAAAVDLDKTSPCPQIEILAEDKIKFTGPEERLVCGDPKLKAYAHVPLYQAEYHLKIFLEERGYHSATFDKSDGKILKVLAGHSLKLKKLELEPPTSELYNQLWRHYHDLPLTSSLLNSLETEVSRYHQETGAACAKSRAVADVRDGAAKIYASDLTPYRFGDIVINEPVPGLKPQAYVRFYPFHPTNLYDYRKLELSAKRFLRNRIVQGTYFQENCDSEPFFVEQKFMVGPPRTLRMGFGISTEDGPLARLRWVHHRFGQMASRLEATLFASFQNQGLSLLSDHFFWPRAPRTSLFSQLELTRDSPKSFEELRVRLREHLQKGWELSSHRLSVRGGPSISWSAYRQSRNSEFTKTPSVPLELSLDFMSHSYESFDLHPAEGRHLTLTLEHRNPFLFFPKVVFKGNLGHREVLPLSVCGRGWCILGLRAEIGMTGGSSGLQLEDLPPSLKHYAGGLEELRGYKPDSLPRNRGAGAFSRALFGIELRRTNVWKRSLEAYAFADGAILGSRPLHFDPTLYAATGLGLRWLSPIGIVQGYGAWSFESFPYHNRGPYFFIGLGGEF